MSDTDKILLHVRHADNMISAYLNGVRVYKHRTENNPVLDDKVDLTYAVSPGINTLQLLGSNWGYSAQYEAEIRIYGQEPLKWSVKLSPEQAKLGIIEQMNVQFAAKQVVMPKMSHLIVQRHDDPRMRTFKGCFFTLNNPLNHDLIRTGVIDFYLSPQNQGAPNPYDKIGDVGYQFVNKAQSQSFVNLSKMLLFGSSQHRNVLSEITREWRPHHPNIYGQENQFPAGTYYLYAQFRRDDLRLVPSEGCYSEPFQYGPF